MRLRPLSEQPLPPRPAPTPEWWMNAAPPRAAAGGEGCRKPALFMHIAPPADGRGAVYGAPQAAAALPSRRGAKPM